MTPPTAPSGLAGEVLSPSTIRLSWTDNSPGEESFRIDHKGQTPKHVREHPPAWAEIDRILQEAEEAVKKRAEAGKTDKDCGAGK